MTKAELHYLNCTDENCEYFFCVARRDYDRQISVLTADHIGWKALHGETRELLILACKERDQLCSLLKSAWGFVDQHDNVGLTRVQLKEVLDKYGVDK